MAKLFGARRATVINALALQFLADAAFTIAGLAERVIRKACARRESATIYHLAKHSYFALLPLALFLCVSVRIDPVWMVLPTILASGFLLRPHTKQTYV